MTEFAWLGLHIAEHWKILAEIAATTFLVGVLAVCTRLS